MFFAFDLIRDSSTTSLNLLPVSLSKSQRTYAKVARLCLKMDFLIKMFKHFNNGVVPDQVIQHREYLEKVPHHYTSRQVQSHPQKGDLIKYQIFLYTLKSIKKSKKSASIDLVNRIREKLFSGKQAFLSKEHLNAREFQALYRELLKLIPDSILFKTEGAIKKLASTSNRLFALSEISSNRSCFTDFTESSPSTTQSHSFWVDYCQDFHLSEHTLTTIGKKAKTNENILNYYALCDEPLQSPELVTTLPLGDKPRRITKYGDLAGTITRTKKVAIVNFNEIRNTQLFGNFDDPSCIDMDSTHFVIGNSLVGNYINSKINLVNYMTGEQSKKIRAHKGDITVVKLTVGHIYSGGTEGVVKIWDRNKFQLVSQTEFSSPIVEVVPDELGNFYSIAKKDNGVTYVDNLTTKCYFFPYENITALHYAHQNVYIGTSKGECIRIDPRFFALKV